MEEALQNVMDYIETEGRALNRANYIALLEQVKDYCDVAIEAAECDPDDETHED